MMINILTERKTPEMSRERCSTLFNENVLYGKINENVE